MKISEIKQLESSVKGFLAIGKVFYIGEVKNRTNKSNGETFTTQSIGISDGNNKETDSIFVEFSNIEELTDAVKGKTISCVSCRINNWQGKRNLRASDYSFDVIPTSDMRKLELPSTTVIKDKEPSVVTHAEQVEASVKPDVWSIKDLKIIRQHESSDAVTLVCKYFKGNLEEAIAEVIKTSAILVNNVYQNLEYPIKEKTQEERVAEMEADSDKNIADAAESVASLRTPTEEGDLIDE